MAVSESTFPISATKIKVSVLVYQSKNKEAGTSVEQLFDPNSPKSLRQGAKSGTKANLPGRQLNDKWPRFRYPRGIYREPWLHVHSRLCAALTQL